MEKEISANRHTNRSGHEMPIFLYQQCPHDHVPIGLTAQIPDGI